jgi:hypothetical protein
MANPCSAEDLYLGEGSNLGAYANSSYGLMQPLLSVEHTMDK